MTAIEGSTLTTVAVVMVAAVWAAFGWILMRLIGKPREEIRVFGGGSIVSPIEKAASR